MVPIPLDWQNAEVSPTETGLLEVAVRVGSLPRGAAIGGLSDALRSLGAPAGPIVSAGARGMDIRLSVSGSADVEAVKSALATRLEKFAEEVETRRGEVEVESAKIAAERAKEEAVAQAMQARFRLP